MGVKHDAAGSSPSGAAMKGTDYSGGSKGLSSGPPSHKSKESTSIVNTLHREIPVHVTMQGARTVGAERPPSNRQRAVQPPGDGGANQKPGDNNANHPFGNGGGGDRDRGDGVVGGGSSLGTLRVPMFRGHYSSGSPTNWRWNCCNCNFGNLDYNYDTSCPGCNHRRCPSDKLCAIE
ncbi:hypothetical protein F4782DRAFT_532560 [Xylaria castorea]|nr:hypothetical protein F4782DRAFT_532560 [Xylaria castorea]